MYFCEKEWSRFYSAACATPQTLNLNDDFLLHRKGGEQARRGLRAASCDRDAWRPAASAAFYNTQPAAFFLLLLVLRTRLLFASFLYLLPPVFLFIYFCCQLFGTAITAK